MSFCWLAYILTYIHATHTHTHTYIHTYTYIHMYVTVYRKTGHKRGTLLKKNFCTYRVVGVQILSSPSFIVTFLSRKTDFLRAPKAFDAWATLLLTYAPMTSPPADGQ